MNQDEQTQEPLAHHLTDPTYRKEVNYMRSVEQVHLNEMLERPHRLGSYRNRGGHKRYVSDWRGNSAGQPTAHPVRQSGRVESWFAELSIVSHGRIKKVGEQVPDSEILRLAFRRRLVAQCSILVVIAGIVAGLIAA